MCVFISTFSIISYKNEYDQEAVFTLDLFDLSPAFQNVEGDRSLLLTLLWHRPVLSCGTPGQVSPLPPVVPLTHQRPEGPWGGPHQPTSSVAISAGNSRGPIPSSPPGARKPQAELAWDSHSLKGQPWLLAPTRGPSTLSDPHSRAQSGNGSTLRRCPPLRCLPSGSAPRSLSHGLTPRDINGRWQALQEPPFPGKPGWILGTRGLPPTACTGSVLDDQAPGGHVTTEGQQPHQEATPAHWWPRPGSGEKGTCHLLGDAVPSALCTHIAVRKQKSKIIPRRGVVAYGFKCCVSSEYL